MITDVPTPRWTKNTDEGPAPKCQPPAGATEDQLKHHHEQWQPTLSNETQARAERLCGGCPIIDSCRDWAVNFNCPTYGRLTGIVGGTTTAERAAIRRKRNKKAA